VSHQVLSESILKSWFSETNDEVNADFKLISEIKDKIIIGYQSFQLAIFYHG
jgi:hypothetical protein